jgi:hypothetical protein
MPNGLSIWVSSKSLIYRRVGIARQPHLSVPFIKLIDWTQASAIASQMLELAQSIAL